MVAAAILRETVPVAQAYASPERAARRPRSVAEGDRTPPLTSRPTMPRWAVQAARNGGDQTASVNHPQRLVLIPPVPLKLVVSPVLAR